MISAFGIKLNSHAENNSGFCYNHLKSLDLLLRKQKGLQKGAVQKDPNKTELNKKRKMPPTQKYKVKRIIMKDLKNRHPKRGALNLARDYPWELTTVSSQLAHYTFSLSPYGWGLWATPLFNVFIYFFKIENYFIDWMKYLKDVQNDGPFVGMWNIINGSLI